ncbi:hypothetical protein BIW11_09416, partial [Tropilaelaps mercedesae]
LPHSEVPGLRGSPVSFDSSGQGTWYPSVSEQMVDRSWNVNNNNNNPHSGCYGYLPPVKYPSPGLTTVPTNPASPLGSLPPYYSHPQFHPETQHSVLQPSLVPVSDQLYAAPGHMQPPQLQGALQQQPRPYSNNSDSTTQSSCDSGVGYPHIGLVYPAYGSPGRRSPKIAQGPQGLEVAEYRLMQRVIPGEYRDYYEQSSVGYCPLAHAAKYPGDGMTHERTDDAPGVYNHSDQSNIHHHQNNHSHSHTLGTSDQQQQQQQAQHAQHNDFHLTNNVNFASQHQHH